MPNLDNPKGSEYNKLTVNGLTLGVSDVKDVRQKANGSYVVTVFKEDGTYEDHEPQTIAEAESIKTFLESDIPLL